MANKFGPGGLFGDDGSTKSAGTIPDATSAQQKPWQNYLLPYSEGFPFNYKTDQYGRIQIPWLDEIFPGVNPDAPYWNQSILADNAKGATYRDLHRGLTQAIHEYNDRYHPLPKDVNRERRELGLGKLGDVGDLNVFAAPLAGAMTLPLASGLEGAGVGSALVSEVPKATSWVARNILMPWLGAEVVDEGMKLTTGKDWATNVKDGLTSVGVPKDWANAAGQIFNPGYFLPYGRVAKPVREFLGKAGEFMGKSKPIKPKPFKSEPFKSELDWSPESWFGKRVDGKWDAEDVAALESHVPEYHEIERLAKENRTWLKMPDGSIWKGDPRSWVQLMSKDGQKLAKRRLLGSTRNRERSLAYPENDLHAWTVEGDNANIFADKWTGKYYAP